MTLGDPQLIGWLPPLSVVMAVLVVAVEALNWINREPKGSGD